MTIQELKDVLRRLFDSDSLPFTEIGNYGLSFTVPGKAKDVMDTLKDRTEPTRWDGDPGNWFYTDDDQDWSLYLRSIPHSVLCLASVRSLHRQHLAQYELTPEQHERIAADEAQNRLKHENWQARNIRTEPLPPLGGPFYTDGERVWAHTVFDCRYTALNNVDLASFRHLIDNFGADASGLRCYTRGDAHHFEREGEGVIGDGDADTLQALGGGWYRDARQAYYLAPDRFDRPGYHLVVVKADVASLQHIGGAYARDAKHLYCNGVRKRGIDDPAHVVGLGYNYASIGNQLLHDGKLITKPGRVEAASARAVFQDVLIDDDGHMLWGRNYRKPLPGIDARSLRFLNYYFAVDAHRVYTRTNTSLVVCDWVDRASVTEVSSFHIRDKDGLIGMLYPSGVGRVADDDPTFG